MNEAFARLAEIKVVPVVAIDDAKDAPALADALIAGGLPCIEITFRTAAAGEALKKMASRTEFLLGAGTVLTVDQVKQAADAGAKFIVSPGVDVKVLQYCADNRIAIAPGVATPTDIQTALSFGLDVLKYFPAEAMGGLKTLKAMSAPFGDIRFIPTGGVSESNLAAYLSFPKVIACGGSWLADRKLIGAGDFGEITRRASAAVEIAKQAK